MSISTQHIENNKDFDFELGFIVKLFSLNSFEVDILGGKKIKARISRQQKTFNIEINTRLIGEDEHNFNLSFILDEIIYETNRLGSKSNSTEIKADRPVNFQTIIELKSFHSKTFNKKGLFKAFFVVDPEEINTFHNQFETVTHVRNGVEYFYDCLRIGLDNIQYDVTQLKSGTSGFYVFECLQEQSYIDFSDACFSIQQAVGFINTVMVGNEKFVFDEKKQFHYSNHIRPAIKGMYSPISTNPYSYLGADRGVADKLFNKLTRLSLKDLSSLVHKIHTELEYSVAILVILEATSIGSLLIILSSFAVIIELFSKHLSYEESGLQTPISDSFLKKRIIKELYKVIDDNSAALKPSSIIMLKRRLNDINKPVNKRHLTNSEKLIRPFEQLGINLTLHDINIIEHRNDLLHGNILLNSDETKNEEQINLYMAYVSAKLFTLISKLILKSIGYNGYIYNQGKYLEKHVNLETDEEYFEKI